MYRRPSKVVKWMSPVTEHSAEGQRRVADPWELPLLCRLRAGGRDSSRPRNQGSVWSPSLRFGSPSHWGDAALPWTAPWRVTRPGDQFWSKALKLRKVLGYTELHGKQSLMGQSHCLVRQSSSGDTEAGWLGRERRGSPPPPRPSSMAGLNPRVSLPKEL